MYITGNCGELGNWDPEKLVGPAVCPNYPTWTLTVYLPANTNIEFKAIKKDESGNATWQDGSNRIYSVPSSGTGQITVNW